MTIPTELEFVEAITLCSKNLSASTEQAKLIPISIDAVSDYMRGFIAEEDALWKTLHLSPAHKWLNSQIGVKRVTRKKFKHTSRDEITDESYFCFRMEPFEKIINSPEIDADTKKRRVVHRIINIGRPSNYRTWKRDVLQSYFDYFHSDRWERIYREYHDRSEWLAAASKAIDVLQKGSSFIVRPIVDPFLSKNLTTAAEQVLLESESDVLNLYPIKRKDGTSKERVLAFDLYQANKKNYRKPKTSDVYDLIGIEGVSNSLDMRTIERMISRIEKAVNDTRHKWHEN